MQSVNAKGTYELLDLSGVFNNDGISYDSNRSDGSFDTWGGTYPAEELPPSHEVVNRRAIPFLFPDKSDGRCNNVALGGEVIRVPPLCYESLYILGSSEMGSFRDVLSLNYANGRREKRMFSLSEFFCRKAYFGDIAALECDHFHVPDRDIRWFEAPGRARARVKARLWLQRIECNGLDALETILFPDNPCMHVFCISLRLR